MKLVSSLLLGCAAISQPCYGAGLPSPVLQSLAKGRALLATSSDHALLFARQQYTISQSLAPADRDLLIATSDWIAAAALSHKGQLKEAALLIERALSIVKRLAPGSLLHAQLLLTRANISSSSGKAQSFLADYQLAYTYFQAAGDKRGEALALQDIAATYLDAGDYATALRYLKDAQGLGVEDPVLHAAISNNIGLAYEAGLNYKEAEKAFGEALNTAKRTDNQSFAVYVATNLADAEVKAGDLNAADAVIRKGMLSADMGGYGNLKAIFFGVSARLALKAGDITEAKRWIQLSFKDDKVAEIPGSLRDNHQTAYEIYKRLGEKGLALFHLEAFKKLDDQARALAASTNAALMSARFDFANQDLKITRLRVGQAERDAALARTQGRFHSALIGGLAFVSVLLALGFVSIRRSRNEVREANRDLQDSNAELEKALAAKSIFLATTSHEIRTPLNGILGMTQVLLADRQIPSDVRNRVQLIHGSGETMKALVDDILDMAKIETGELRLHPAPMDLKQLLVDAGAVWTGQAQTKQVGLELALDDCPGGIVADEVRLRQIVFNLMSNAIKFTDRGQVRLAARAEPHGEGEQVVITIQDSGVGIPADRLADIFESFRQVDGGVTRRHGGTGLGLAICRSIARAMGGDVTVSSVLGTGSTFTVTLPLERAQVAASQTREAPVAAATLAEARLLLLEPNPLAQGILRALLTPQVAALEVASDLEAAATLLVEGRFHHLLADAAAFNFDVQAFHRFRAAHDIAHVTLLWATPSPEIQAAIAAEPGVRLLAKPIAAPDLLAGLRMSYHVPRADHELAA